LRESLVYALVIKVVLPTRHALYLAHNVLPNNAIGRVDVKFQIFASDRLPSSCQHDGVQVQVFRQSQAEKSNVILWQATEWLLFPDKVNSKGPDCKVEFQRDKKQERVKNCFKLSATPRGIIFGC
jgi:hypothetical protein